MECVLEENTFILFGAQTQLCYLYYSGKQMGSESIFSTVCHFI